MICNADKCGDANESELFHIFMSFGSKYEFTHFRYEFHVLPNNMKLSILSCHDIGNWIHERKLKNLPKQV